MHSISTLCSAAIAFFAFAGHTSTELNHWIQSQVKHAEKRLLANISPATEKPWRVIASTSRANPDYYFHWVRDAALVMRPILTSYQHVSDAAQKTTYHDLLKAYAESARRRQLTPNPSGDITSGGLGEPKFHVDGSAFKGPWGRPQNDGPALRAILLSEWALSLLSDGKENTVKNLLYGGHYPAGSVIKSDLEYVSHNWREPCMDLWEETWGYHFYTRLVQRRALLIGAHLARKLGDVSAATWYEKNAKELETAIAGHWDGNKKRLLPTLDGAGPSHASGLDVAILLGAMHAHGLDNYYSVDSDPILASTGALITQFENQYGVNKVRADSHGSLMAPAIGRYPEDIYDGNGFSGGNPWVLATNAVAEHLYRLVRIWESKKEIRFTEDNKGFFEALKIPLPRAPLPYTLTAKDPHFRKVLLMLHTQGDRFLNRVRYHAKANGDLSEQIQRSTGFMTGAENLTWSYASFLTATHFR